MTEQPIVYLIASGDLRLAANQTCWPAQDAMEKELVVAIENLGFRVQRAHAYDPATKHGFISSQRQGLDVFKNIDAESPLIVAEAVWQYSHHVLPGLTTHRGPLLTVANWSGQWPGLVGMLNLNGSLTKAGVKYSTLWGEDFADADFIGKLKTWLQSGEIVHRIDHVAEIVPGRIEHELAEFGKQMAYDLMANKAIMGVFDEGCMGMFNAIIPDHLLNAVGVFKERLSQSALYFETTQVSDDEARECYQWYLDQGFRFHLGSDEATDLTESQILLQCKTYIAALRIADDFGCDTIGIQYQQGLKDLLPASDLVEGSLNSTSRPPVRSRCGSRELYAGKSLPHFNEVDECAGLDALLIQRIHGGMEQPVETTLHDLRWGDWDQSGTTDEYVWVFEISGSAPAEHHVGGWSGSEGFRQPPMYFPLGGSTLRGIAKAGEIIWSRIFVKNDRLQMDIGRGKAIDLPAKETQRRWDSTTPQWPIMHGVCYGVSRDQMMARHKANHIQLAYGTDVVGADDAMFARVAMAQTLGIEVHLCGTQKCGSAW
ncbi:MAG: fucose isomerase [Pirellulaceae bacterium]